MENEQANITTLWASVAEAVAHYYSQGYGSVPELAGEARRMVKGQALVIIRKVGLLDVRAQEVAA